MRPATSATHPYPTIASTQPPAPATPDDATLRENLAELATHWESEGKRCYELAHKRTKVEETVMAQSVRFFECARELREAVERDRAICAGGKG